VLQYLECELKVDEAVKAQWYRHWVTVGFTALETMLKNSPVASSFCHGHSPTLADCCLIPQVANARRFSTPLDDFPNICRIDAVCADLPAFQHALPQVQPDAG
jgi:maleylacetoacetate isomerase